MSTKQNLTDKELLFSKQVANEVEKKFPLLVAREVEKFVKPSIENMRIHFSKKLGDEMVRLDTSLREIKSNNKGSKKSKNDAERDNFAQINEITRLFIFANSANRLQIVQLSKCEIASNRLDRIAFLMDNLR